uniref:UvrABC system protein A n=1 Tax=Lygus hesperus TaxID=30085 RepID=A0A0A9WJC6_LYGHE
MLQHSCKYLVFGWHTRSLFFILAVLSNGELQQERERLQENDNRVNPAYLNPDLYREGIASLVNAKERAEEMMFKNDLIAQLVTEMPYHEIQNRLLISGNHKEENRSFFENLSGKKKQWNCGKGFDIYKLLDMVQRSRERAENMTLYYSLSTTSSTLPKSSAASSQKQECKTEEYREPLSNQGAAIPMVGEPGGYQAPSGQVPPAEAYSPVPQMNFPFEQMQMQIKPTTILYRQFQSLVKFPIHKVPPLPDGEAPISSAALSQGSDNLLLQPKEDKPPMLIPILEKSFYPHPVNSLLKAVDTKKNRVGVGKSNDDPGFENGYQNFKYLISQRSRT